MEKSKQNLLMTSNMLFMILAYVFIAGSFAMTYLKVDFRWSVLIIQYGIILLPILIVMKMKGVHVSDQFKFKSISFKTGFKVVLITLFALPIAYTLNLLVNYILIKLDLFQLQVMDFGDTSGPLNIGIIVFLVAVSPGICEEFFFRGMMWSTYEKKMPPFKAMVLTGIMFGLFHFNLQNLMLPTFLGVIFAWFVYTTDSIYSSMIAHGLFNLIGSVIMILNQRGPAIEDVDTTLTIMKEQGGIALIGMAVLSLLSGAVMVALMFWLKSDYFSGRVHDTIVIKDKKMLIVATRPDSITVIHEEEERIIKYETLKQLSYKIEHVPKSYEPISKANYFFVGMVVILYLAFTVFSYT